LRGWLLDTNVISEPVRKMPDAKVTTWLRELPRERTYISILTLGEIDQGIAALKAADPRRAHFERFRLSIEADFAGRILPVEDEVVRLWGAMSGRYKLDPGGKAPVVDTMLAATAQMRRLHLATRNIKDVRALSVSAFSPWTDDPSAFPIA
jgi:toxin FitB